MPEGDGYVSIRLGGSAGEASLALSGKPGAASCRPGSSPSLKPAPSAPRQAAVLAEAEGGKAGSGSCAAKAQLADAFGRVATGVEEAGGAGAAGTQRGSRCDAAMEPSIHV